MKELKLSECKWPEVYISIPKEIAKESLQYQNKMTAVEWFNQQLVDRQNGNGDSRSRDEIFEQAKEMEKEQIVEAFFQGVDRESDGHGAMYLSIKDAEQYYNETFKSE